MAHSLNISKIANNAAISRETRSLALGGAVFLALLLASLTSVPGVQFGTLELALVAAFWLIVPGALLLAGPGTGTRAAAVYRALLNSHPAAAAAAVLALLLPPGAAAAALSSVWALFVIGMAALGALRFFGRANRFQLDELVIDAGLVYPLIAASAFVPASAGLPYFGFYAPWPLLTAMHFHYAGLLVPVFTGLVGRVLNTRFTRVYALAAWGVIAGSGAVGIGILTSQLLETLSVLILSTALWILAVLVILGVLPQTRNALLRVGLAVSALVFCVSMPLAIMYSAGELTGNVWITLPQMIDTHGRLNFVGFGLFGLFSWLALRPAARFVTHPDLAKLDLLRTEPLTFALSQDEAGMKVHTLEKVMGHDKTGRLFNQIGDLLLRYKLYPDHVISSVSDFGNKNRHAAIGDRILLRLHLLHVFGVSIVNFPVLVEVVDTLDQPREKSLTYCSTRWHLAKGGCKAQLVWRPDGAVVLSLRSVETPINRILMLPVIKPVFRMFLDRALRKAVENVTRSTSGCDTI